jgi:hypothetical protein
MTMSGCIFSRHAQLIVSHALPLAARVADAVADIGYKVAEDLGASPLEIAEGVSNLASYFSHLVEIHSAPSWLWSALVRAMLDNGCLTPGSYARPADAAIEASGEAAGAAGGSGLAAPATAAAGSTDSAVMARSPVDSGIGRCRAPHIQYPAALR